MKLANKLILSFSVVIALLLIMTFIVWHSINELNRQQSFILETEDIINSVADIRMTGMEAIAAVEPEQLKKVNALITQADNQINSLHQLTNEKESQLIIEKLNAKLDEFLPIYKDINLAFDRMVQVNTSLMQLGRKINNDIVQLRQILLQNHEDARMQVLADIKNEFTTVRIALANCANIKNEETYSIARNALATAKENLATPNSDTSEINHIKTDIASYYEKALPFLEDIMLIHNNFTAASHIMLKMTEMSTELSDFARNSFLMTKDNVIQQVLTCSAISLIIALCLSIFLSKNITAQLGADPNELLKIAQDVTNGTFIVDENHTYTGVYKALTDMVITTTEQTKHIAIAHENMVQTAKQLEDIANVTTNAMHELSAQIEISGQGAEGQANQISSTATALEEMNATVLEIAQNAASTAEDANNVKTHANNGTRSMQECIDGMEDVKQESIRLQTEMEELSKQAQNIDEIMNVISNIADQTNLLALNAAIEAARAGEAGRGFAVVADEVRKLAEKTMASTTDVANAINNIQQSTQANTQMVTATVKKIEKITEMVNSTGIALTEISSLSDITADQIRAIATASEEQSATCDEITRSTENINLTAKKNAHNMQEAQNAIGDMLQQTKIINSLIEQLQK